ncbi:hypothetical protein [Roseomonas elaeocarpi]|uniref:DUF3035 domain-containing protein n=1 Tax=Roseomonas elaeocarpi TaxID=907779 RepID=A0ABV6JTE4_9PROT
MRPWKVMALLLPVLALGACDTDPMERPGTWQASGVNDRNLRAMLVDPGQLERGGVGTSTANGGMGAAAVNRLLNGKVRPLLEVRTSKVGGSEGAGAGAAAAP